MQKVSQALAEAAQQEPHLAPYYEFYRALLELQYEAKGEITATLEMADEEALQSRVIQGLPLVSFAQLPIQAARFAKLAAEIAQEMVEYDVKVEDRTLFTDDDEWVSLAQQRFETNQAIKERDQESPEAKATLAQMAVDMALKPYLEWAAEQVLPHVDQAHWKQSHCPVCGGAPDLATLDKEAGTRHLVCSRCNSQWLYRRLGCVFCDTIDHSKLMYYPSEDKVYRLYVCNECRHYLKTIDLRETERAMLLPVERITTVAMDAAAQQEGYLG